MQKWAKLYIAAFIFLGSVATAMAVEVPQAEWERMKQRMAELESRGASMPSTSSVVDVALDSKFGPGANVTTKTGKLTISGLVQVWYYAISQQERGFFDDPVVNGIPDDGRTQSNNGFRIRRTELKFTADINECITGVVMIDPAREAAGFPQFPSNLGNTKKQNLVSPEFNEANGPAGAVNTSTIAAVQNGAFGGGPPRLLQDAYINYHGAIPHHDIQIGQFKPWSAKKVSAAAVSSISSNAPWLVSRLTTAIWAQASTVHSGIAAATTTPSAMAASSTGSVSLTAPAHTTTSVSSRTAQTRTTTMTSMPARWSARFGATASVTWNSVARSWAAGTAKATTTIRSTPRTLA